MPDQLESIQDLLEEALEAESEKHKHYYIRQAQQLVVTLDAQVEEPPVSD